MKFLVLGATGQLGRTFLTDGGLARRGVVVAASRDGLLAGGESALVADLAQPDSLIPLLEAERPDVIVNAAAYTAVDKAETEAAIAERINGDALAVLGAWAARHGALVVHYSTDYVFDGGASSPYTEDAPTSPASAYGRSKLAGEDALRRSGAPHYIFRTAWVYSSVGNNFLRTMLRLGAERGELRIVADQRGTPTSTSLIVAATLGAIDAWLARDAARRAELQGTYHLTANGETTWHGFAEYLLRRAAEQGLLPRLPKITPIATADFPTPARRPAYSVLATGRFARTFGFDVPAWQTGVDDVLTLLSEHAE
ncbi:dTDP-4-dehydrorhamnose reductase [Luteibacter sp. NPDC031894]|uniref:dTDP-4-dehydrorhamnose reductase n=1 Tax=Luteibacter sp. NPDC031894 TaxID=3390572 RepID=UPI003D079E82